MVKQTPTLEVPDDACDHVASCALFPLFTSKGTAGLYKIHYCYGDYKSCARYAVSARGGTPPLAMMPDGSKLGSR